MNEWVDGDNHIYLLDLVIIYINLPCNPKILNCISVPAGSTLPPLSPAAFLQHERLMTGLLVLVPNSESLCHGEIREFTMKIQGSHWSL